MPRVIDLSQGREASRHALGRLPSPVYGEREMRAEEFAAIEAAYEGPVSGFSRQFTTYGVTDPIDRGAETEAAHDWLSRNATGPWSWREHRVPHSHHPDVDVYIERIPDQVAFAAAHEGFMVYKTENNYFQGLAMSRGVLPPRGDMYSFERWTAANAGYKRLGDVGKLMSVAFTHPGVERAFLDRWGRACSRYEADGVKSLLVDPKPRLWRGSPEAWLARNAAVSEITGGHAPEGYRYKVEARYDDVAEALARDWGHAFEREENGTTFSAERYPFPPDRPIPEDFLAYLRGEAETYEAPHLPESLAPYRQASAAAPGMR